jgi:hypothetical protein
MVRSINSRIRGKAIIVLNNTSFCFNSLAFIEYIIETFSRICIHEFSLQASRESDIWLSTIDFLMRREITLINEMLVSF